jgi:hypothetical protein
MIWKPNGWGAAENVGLALTVTGHQAQHVYTTLHKTKHHSHPLPNSIVANRHLGKAGEQPGLNTG